jgi:hypothetical protein
MGEDGQSTRVSANYSLHNYNLKYFLIRQLLEKKDAAEIASLHEQ